MRRTHMEVTSSMDPAEQEAPVVLEPLGLEPFDTRTGGLLARAFNLLEVPDADAGAAALGHFLHHGLAQGRRAALVVADHPHLLLDHMARFGFDFAAALDSAQLVCLHPQPTMVRTVALASDYRALAREIHGSAGYVRRIAFAQVEPLFNLQSECLARISAAKLAAAVGATGATVLGLAAAPTGEPGLHLRKAAQALLPGCLRLTGEGPGHYALGWTKGRDGHAPLKLALRQGGGYVAADG